MISHSFLSTALLLLGAPAFVTGASPALDSETGEQLLARIQTEHNPVKKSLLETRLARIELVQAIHTYDQGNFEQGARLLSVFLDRIEDSWQVLRSSRRDAVRQPHGFRELEIALREDARSLEDLQRRVSYYNREPIEKVDKEVERVRTEVLQALFPSSQAPKPAKPQAEAVQKDHRSP